MRVVHVGARDWNGELVDELLARLYGLLGYARYAVHPVDYRQAVPVDARVLGEAVVDADAQGLALSDPNLRSRNPLTVTSGRDLAPADLEPEWGRRKSVLPHPARSGAAIFSFARVL